MGLRQAFIAIGSLAWVGSAWALPLINEFEPNPGGGAADPATQQIELIGTPLAPFVGVLVAIDSDSPSTSSITGKINDIIPIDSAFDANGLLLVTADDLENPSLTLVLADSYTGNGSTDLDVDDDGVIDDLSFFGTVFDAIGIPDSTADEARLYGTDFGGQDFAYTGAEPALIFRDAATGDWYARNDSISTPDDEELFDITAVNVSRSIFTAAPDPTLTTFGSPNPSTAALPVPGDTNADGYVDNGDLAVSISNFTGPQTDPPTHTKTVSQGDTDGDGAVDNGDLAASISNFTGPPPAPIPEPTALALLGLGSLLITRRRRTVLNGSGQPSAKAC